MTEKWGGFISQIGGLMGSKVTLVNFCHSCSRYKGCILPLVMEFCHFCPPPRGYPTISFRSLVLAILRVAAHVNTLPEPEFGADDPPELA
ncbi:hypothetical protein KTGMC3_P1764 [Methanocalculus sp. MC3]